MLKTNWLKIWACMLMFVFAAGAIGLPVGVLAQGSTTTQHTVVKKKNFAERHPTMTGVAAGMASYKVAKQTGKNRAAAGGKRNFAQRHPMMTGIATGMVVHKVAKDSGKNKK
jgi:hypothetical protein